MGGLDLYLRKICENNKGGYGDVRKSVFGR